MRGRDRTNWSCKKTAKPGDLYLFYFGQSIKKVAGLAVCRVPPDPKGEIQSNGRKMFFCHFERLHHFKEPVTVDELREHPVLDSWWQKGPYHGRPKTIPPKAASTLLRMIATREPKKTASLLDEYVKECGTAPVRQDNKAQPEAYEGTFHERLSRQAVRSKVLRDAKIRITLADKGRLECEVLGCKFDFLEVYGELGRGFAHVHHRRSLAKRKAGRTTLTDLAIVCANCHAMIHRGGSCRTLQSLIVSKVKSPRSLPARRARRK